MRPPGVFGLAILVLLLAPGALAADAPLADAAERGDRAAVRALLDRREDPDRSQADGMTALHWAARRDDPEMARLLVLAGADAKAANRYGVTPLSLACENGDEAIVALLLDAGADPNAPLRGGETPLMTAARAGRPGPVKALLARGAGVDAKERRGQTALMWAAAEGHEEVVQILLAAKADFRTPLASGFTPLAFAAREGRIGAALALIKAGADVNEPMQPREKGGERSPAKGTTPLILAVENGHFELAAMLLDAGADPNDQRSGFTPLHMLTWVRKPPRGDDAAGDPPPIGSGKLTSLQLVEVLARHGADVNARLKRGASGKGVLGRAGATPFLLACMTADVPYMKELLRLGADPRMPNARGSTPLMAAAGLGCLAPDEEAGTEDEALEAVELLLSLGNDVNAVDLDGETAMHGAAYKNFPRVVSFLAAHGAKPEIWNRPDAHDWTPLSIAEGHRPGNFKPSPETLDALRRVLPPGPPARADTPAAAGR
ncbi:ankyrin repeat domain-containing protein [Aquisphaera giovannonii]|uniref:ankyrin repeat domain-containing protein n=1 Tax=Aquisphaera giovannonii TaxID=406548 RepID=UPI001FE645E9|nr:ankyrin repeat domain-containing protein [Aquisphaera giovannonii]